VHNGKDEEAAERLFFCYIERTLRSLSYTVKSL